MRDQDATVLVNFNREEEIGRLREQIEQFKRGRGHSASDANTSEIANVG